MTGDPVVLAEGEGWWLVRPVAGDDWARNPDVPLTLELDPAHRVRLEADAQDGPWVAVTLPGGQLRAMVHALATVLGEQSPVQESLAEESLVEKPLAEAVVTGQAEPVLLNLPAGVGAIVGTMLETILAAAGVTSAEALAGILATPWPALATGDAPDTPRTGSQALASGDVERVAALLRHLTTPADTGTASGVPPAAPSAAPTSAPRAEAATPRSDEQG